MPRTFLITCPCKPDGKKSRVCDKGMKRRLAGKQTESEFRQWLEQCMAAHVYDCHRARCHDWNGVMDLVKRSSEVTSWDWDVLDEDTEDVRSSVKTKACSRSRSPLARASRSSDDDDDTWWPIDLELCTDKQLASLRRAVMSETEARVAKDA